VTVGDPRVVTQCGSLHSIRLVSGAIVLCQLTLCGLTALKTPAHESSLPKPIGRCYNLGRLSANGMSRWLRVATGGD